MPRPKNYNEKTVLDAAMLCFWHRGYFATSMKDLQRTTGLTPGSIYNSFGSKDELFLRSLDHYIDRVVCGRVQRFLISGDPIDGIEKYFIDSFRARVDGAKIGCLLVNTSTELGPHEEIVRAKVAAGIKVAVEGIAKALERAEANGQLPAGIEPKTHAAHLGLLMNGMLVNSKVKGGGQWLSVAMEIVKNLLH